MLLLTVCVLILHRNVTFTAYNLLTSFSSFPFYMFNRIQIFPKISNCKQCYSLIRTVILLPENRVKKLHYASYVILCLMFHSSCTALWFSCKCFYVCSVETLPSVQIETLSTAYKFTDRLQTSRILVHGDMCFRTIQSIAEANFPMEIHQVLSPPFCVCVVWFCDLMKKADQNCHYGEFKIYLMEIHFVFTTYSHLLTFICAT